MQKLISLRTSWAWLILVIIDTLGAGFGMGVPFLCILFGLPVGWYITKRALAHNQDIRQALGKLMRTAAFTASYTFVLLAVIWSSTFLMLFDPAADLANYGIPQILYEPRASFIGWLVLMVVISPFLQFLMTLFGSNLTLLLNRSKREKPAEIDFGNN